MEKKKNQQANKGLIVFICIALALVIGFGAVVWLPKLLQTDEPTPTEYVVDASTDTPAPTIYVTPEPTQALETILPYITDLPTETPVIPTEVPYITDKGGVSCSNPLATAVGTMILEMGGNAADAAVAMAFTLGVVEPYASGIGGGGGMLVYDPTTGASMFYDYRDAACEDISASSTVAKIGVPGLVLGMETVSQKYCSMSWGELLQPAIEYAENGFAISESFARHLYTSRSKLSSRRCPQFYNGNNLLTEGEMIYQTELAETLRLIQRYGSNVFYHGAIAEHIIENTFLKQEDFDMYQCWARKPVTGTYKGLKIISAPAPFAGTTLIQMLKIAEALELESYEDDILRYGNLMACIASVTCRDRRKNICDPQYHEVPQSLLTDEYIADLIEEVRNSKPEYIEPDPEHESTTHFSVIDKNGMMVSATNTLSDFFGYGVYVDGFFLNNTMVTSSGNPQARNYCVRGQRPRSFAMPTFIFGEDGFVMSLGSSGGDRIPQVMFQILTSFFAGEDLQAASDKFRIFMDGIEYCIEDSSIDPNNLLSRNGFYKKGWNSREYFGAFNAVYVKDGVTYGSADIRRNGSFATEN